MASPIKFSQNTNDGLKYNVPDNFERNPEIIRAEMALLSTPAAQAYSVEAYNAIKNVQDQCAIDYKNLCAPISPLVYILSVPDIFNHLDMVFGHRSLSENNEEAFESKGAKLVKTMQSYYKPFGALGYGADGDMCMYAHSDELSQPCVDSVQALYQLRDRYWHESQPPNHCHFVGFLLLGLVAVWGVRRWMWPGRIMKMRNFLFVLHANPALKATVEAKTGLKVPEVRCGGLRSRHSAIAAASAVHSSDACSAEQGEEGLKYSCCARLCINITRYVGLFMLSFFLADTAMEDTGRINHWLNHLSGADIPRQYDDEPERPGVTVFGALTILFIVYLVKITITCLCIKAAGIVYKYFTRGGNGNNNDASTFNGATVVNATAHGDYKALPSPTDGSSAPPGSPMNKKPAATRYTAVNANGPALSTNALIVPTHVPRIWGRWSTPSASSGFFSARRANGYSPVSGHDQDYDTEMVTVRAHVTTQAQVQQQYVLVPVTATPMSTISMV